MSITSYGIKRWWNCSWQSLGGHIEINANQPFGFARLQEISAASTTMEYVARSFSKLCLDTRLPQLRIKRDECNGVTRVPETRRLAAQNKTSPHELENSRPIGTHTMKISWVLLSLLLLVLTIDAAVRMGLIGKYAAAGFESNKVLIEKQAGRFVLDAFFLGCGLLALVLTRDTTHGRTLWHTDFSKAIPPNERGSWRRSESPRRWQLVKTIPASVLLFGLFINVLALPLIVSASLFLLASGAFLWLKLKELESEHGECFTAGYHKAYLKDLHHLKTYRLSLVEFLLSANPVQRRAHPG